MCGKLCDKLNMVQDVGVHAKRFVPKKGGRFKNKDMEIGKRMSTYVDLMKGKLY